MKKTSVLLGVLLPLTMSIAAAQDSTGNKRLGDRAASGYNGKVKLASKITLKKAPDSLLHSVVPFDSLYLQMKAVIDKNYATLGTYFRNEDKPGYIDAAIVNEAFDTAGNAMYEEDIMAANAMNVTYRFGTYKENKSTITIYSNHSGQRTGTGYVQWKGYSERIQHLSTTNGIDIDATIQVENNTPAWQTSVLRFKDAFVITAQTRLLSRDNEREVWLHTEVSKNLYKNRTEPALIDTMTHNIISKDAEGNMIKELVTHSNKKEYDEVVFHQYTYYR